MLWQLLLYVIYITNCDKGKKNILYFFLSLWKILKHLFFNVYQPQYEKKRREGEKECDVHVIQQPLCSLSLLLIYSNQIYQTTIPFFCAFFLTFGDSVLFWLIMFRSYIYIYMAFMFCTKNLIMGPIFLFFFFF